MYNITGSLCICGCNCDLVCIFKDLYVRLFEYISSHGLDVYMYLSRSICVFLYS